MTTFDKESPGYANRTAKKRGTDKVTASLQATPSKKAAIIKTIMNSPRTRTILGFFKVFLLITGFFSLVSTGVQLSAKKETDMLEEYKTLTLSNHNRRKQCIPV